MDAGYLPHSISTDINVFNLHGPVHSLATTMSKIWALGVPLMDVIAMVTTNPAETMKCGDAIGRIAVGRDAHLSVLQITEAPVTLSDGYRSIKADRVLEPVGCTVCGTWYDADSYVSAEVIAA